MSGIRKNRSRGGTTSTPAGDPTHPVPKAGNEYKDDNVTRMPLDNSVLAMRSAQRLARQLQARSGRTSTRLANNAGIAPYVASLMGSTS